MTNSEREFDAWAPFYDMVHSGLPGEQEFYIRHAGVGGHNVLDLGCGTGRISIPLARAGCRVTGLDVSRGMLAVCAKNLAELSPPDGSLELAHADMSQFYFAEKFDAVVMAYRTFMHLHTQEQQLSCLRCVRDHLADGGRLFMNTWNPQAGYIYAHRASPKESEYTLVDVYGPDERGEAVQHFHRVQCDVVSQLMREEHLLVRFDKDDREIERVELPLVRAWSTVREMRLLFSLSGLEVETLHGDFDGAAFGNDSQESIWIVKRADAT